MSFALTLILGGIFLTVLLRAAALAALLKIPLSKIMAHKEWPRLLRETLAIGALALLLGAVSFLFAGCKKIPWGKKKNPAISGTINAAKTLMPNEAEMPNAVCYLFLKDNWNVPIVVKRWLNPRFPLYFRLTPNDLYVPTRPWKGPYTIEAYLFTSDSKTQELPPPPDAAYGAWPATVEPGSQNITLVLKKKG